MDSIEAQLSGALEDTQESLATALARVEALRIREKHLLQDNARLRVKLREAGVAEIGSGSVCSSPSGSPKTAGSAGALKDLAVDGVCVADSGPPLELTSLAQQHPVIIHTSSSKELPASVVTTPDSLEFFERRARISAAEFVGMSSVSPSEKSGSGKSSWISYMFGKPKGSKSKSSKDSKTTGQPPLPSKGGASREVPLVPVAGTTPKEAGTRFDEYLDRHSWNGEVRGRTEDATAPQGDTEDDGHKAGLWQVLWKDGGGNGKLRRIIFEAGVATQAFVHQHIESWSRGAQEATSSKVESPNTPPPDAAQASSPSENAKKQRGEQGELVPPKHFIPDGMVPVLNEESALLTEDHLKCLTGAIPKRHRQAGWTLLYSTAKHGISLHTLYRRAANIAPSILVVRDTSDFMFGAYCSESWRMAPRFYGTGETFVFQLEPHRIYYPWKKESKVRNDFFMYGSMESIGVGGTGHFAMWLDGELLYGHSGMSDTFGSPCLASEDEFKIMTVELWGLS